MDINDMTIEWAKFCGRMNISEKNQHFFDEIKQKYSVPERYYHTFEGHIGEGLEDLASVWRMCDQPDEVYFAWINHDVIQDTSRTDNEEKSTEFAYDIARRMFLPRRFIYNAGRLIMATKHLGMKKDEEKVKAKKATSIDEHIITDIDLAIFGKNQERFDEYEAGIRAEYSFVTKEVFREKRREILRMFLDKNRIYTTQCFFDMYETKARENLVRSIEMLES